MTISNDVLCLGRKGILHTNLVKKQQDPHLTQTDFNFSVHPSLRNNLRLRGGLELKSHQLFNPKNFDGL